jgi:hypothetical protein
MIHLKDHKYLFNGVSLIIILILASCLSPKEYLVESDYSYSGNFKEYKTYSFLKYYKYNQDSLTPDNIIMDAIKYRMSILGYKQDDKNPNILVSYKIYYKDFKFKGYDQPEFEEWLNDKQHLKEAYDPVKYKLMEGTMIIILIDRKRNTAIWQGYNSGLLQLSSPQSEKFVKGTVRTIFDKYRVFAEGFLKEG